MYVFILKFIQSTIFAIKPLNIIIFQNRIACTGAILWSVLDCTHGWRLYLQFSVFTFGVYGSRVYAATLALSLVCAVTYPSIYVEKLKPYFLVSGIIIPSFLVGVQLLTVQVSKYRSMDFFLARVKLFVLIDNYVLFYNILYS